MYVCVYTCEDAYIYSSLEAPEDTYTAVYTARHLLACARISQPSAPHRSCSPCSLVAIKVIASKVSKAGTQKNQKTKQNRHSPQRHTGRVVLAAWQQASKVKQQHLKVSNTKVSNAALICCSTYFSCYCFTLLPGCKKKLKQRLLRIYRLDAKQQQVKKVKLVPKKEKTQPSTAHREYTDWHRERVPTGSLPFDTRAVEILKDLACSVKGLLRLHSGSYTDWHFDALRFY